ncbi:MAG TPA: ABC transporter substrate-binding protein, partial [Burkholderiaceae bacterium]|nr:ABC transporter substrate-binding protein [Burkholderiaceae bacterium]
MARMMMTFARRPLPQNPRRRWLQAWAMAALAAAGVPPAQAQDSLKIGVIAPFNTPPGDGLLNAARLAADDINAAGGIGGRKVELVLANDEY